MTVKKMIHNWHWFQRQWKPKVNMPRPNLKVKWMTKWGGYCTDREVVMPPWGTRRTLIHEFGHWFGYKVGEAAVGAEFLRLAGFDSFNYYEAPGKSPARESWANTVVGLLLGKWAGGNTVAAEAIRPLLRGH